MLFYLKIPVLAQLRIPGILFLEAGPFLNFYVTKKEERVGPGRYPNNKCYDEMLFGAGAALGIGHVKTTILYEEPDKWDGSYIILNKLQVGIGYWF